VSGPFTVRLAQLADVIDQLDRFDQHLESALAEADRRVDELHVTWSGAAARAHRAAHDEWTRGAADMRAGLAAMRAIAATAHANYTAAVTANAQMWQQVR
jgi:WXG100 family type VII secretion target